MVILEEKASGGWTLLLLFPADLTPDRRRTRHDRTLRPAGVKSSGHHKREASRRSAPSPHLTSLFVDGSRTTTAAAVAVTWRSPSWVSLVRLSQSRVSYVLSTAPPSEIQRVLNPPFRYSENAVPESPRVVSYTCTGAQGYCIVDQS